MHMHTLPPERRKRTSVVTMGGRATTMCRQKGSVLVLFFLSLVLGPWILGLKGVDVAF